MDANTKTAEDMIDLKDDWNSFKLKVSFYAFLLFPKYLKNFIAGISLV